MEKTVSSTKEVKLNQFGKRVIENWCLYAQKLAERKRIEDRKEVLVSRITEHDKKVFDEACKKLRRQRAKTEGPKRLLLKKLASSRSVRAEKIQKVNQAESSNYEKCVIDYKKKASPKSSPKCEPKLRKPQTSTKKLQRQKPQIKLPPLKTKPWRPPGLPKRKLKPVVVIPPFKTRPWVPCPPLAKPKAKPVIEYPPLKLRKKPWQFPAKTTKPRSPKTPIRVKLDQIFYPSAFSTLGKTWHLFKFITPKIHILRGRTSQYSKKFNFSSNGKQSAFIAVVALVNAHVCPMKHWGPDDLDEIVSFGDINYRKQLRRHAAMKPPEIKFKVYTSRSKICTEIGAKTLKGIFDPQHTKDLQTDLEQVIAEFSCLVFTYCGQSYAIWKELNAFYIFNSEDTDESGRWVEKTRGACCVIRSPKTISQIVEYLASFLRVPKKCYEIYSFKVKEKISEDQEIRKLFPDGDSLSYAEQPDEPRVDKPYIGEESTIPAVAAPIDCEPRFESDSMDLEDLLEKIKLKRGCSSGFIGFANGGLICGQLSKESKRFNQFTRVYHSGAICLLSIAMSSLKDLNCWCGDTIDSAVTSGYSLYIESSVANNSNEVDLSMLITSLNLSGSEIKMKVEPFKEILAEDLAHKSLSVTLCEMFSHHTNGYLCRGVECWAMMKRGKAFYVFDPLGIQVREKKCVRRRAVLYKFDCVGLMAKQLMNSLDDIFGDGCEEVCKLGTVLCCPTFVCMTDTTDAVVKKPWVKIAKPKIRMEVKQSFNQKRMMLKDVEPTCDTENEDICNDCTEFPCAN